VCGWKLWICTCRIIVVLYRLYITGLSGKEAGLWTPYFFAIHAEEAHALHEHRD
jgi:hypothetical protein